MKELEFSFMEGRPGDSKDLLPLLDEFENQHHIHVNLVVIPWETAWAQNVKYAIYGHGPDVSAVGASWIGSLASMQALRPFTRQEINRLGGSEAYFESIWQVGQLVGDPTVWAIPWYGDVRVLYYWKEALEKEGIDDFQEAFKTDAALVKTLEKLQKHGISYPLAITTHPISQILHECSHWIWNAGGNFVSPDGKQVTFNEPKALEGFKNYFSLLPFISPSALQTDPGDLFRQKASLVHVSGSWIPGSILDTNSRSDLGVSPLPSPAYMGGTNLAIWQYTTKFEQAFELIEFLSTRPIFQNISQPQYTQVPVRRETLDLPMTQKDPFNRTYLKAFQSGRSFPTLRLWGSIEDRLIPAVATMWKELFTDPGQDLDACLHRHLDPLAERLNTALGN